MKAKALRVRAGSYLYRGHLIEEVSFDAGERHPRWNIKAIDTLDACDAASSLAQAKAMIDGWFDDKPEGKPLIEIL